MALLGQSFQMFALRCTVRHHHTTFGFTFITISEAVDADIFRTWMETTPSLQPLNRFSSCWCKYTECGVVVYNWNPKQDIMTPDWAHRPVIQNENRNRLEKIASYDHTSGQFLTIVTVVHKE